MSGPRQFKAPLAAEMIQQKVALLELVERYQYRLPRSFHYPEEKTT